MATISLNLQDLAGQSGLTLDVRNARHREVIETGIALTETSTGVFEGTSTDSLGGNIYILDVKSSGGLLLKKITYRSAPVPPTHGGGHLPSGQDGEVLIHNGTEFTSVDNDAISNLVADDIQGYYGLLTNFYFVGSTPTVTEIDTDDVDQWIDINFDVDALGNFDNRPSAMKMANTVGHTGAGTPADPIVFDLEGLTQAASCNFRASLTFEPDVDEAQLETRLLFNRHSGTTPSDDFPIADVSLSMTQGADIEYDAEPMLSFFVGDTIDTNGVGDAGKCRFQVRSSVEGTLRMRALTWYIQS